MSRHFFCRLCQVEVAERSPKVRVPGLTLSVAGRPHCREPLRLVRKGEGR